MMQYIFRRILMAIPLLIGITILSYAIIRLAPGGPTALLIDPSIKPQDLAKMEEKFGVNDPIYVGYIKWVGDLVQGDFGTSYIKRGTPVSELIWNRLPNTILLMVSSTLIAAIIAIPFGIYSAMRPYSLLDYSATVVSFVGVATPNFWLGIMLIMYLAVQWSIFPTGGVMTIGADFSIWDRLHHLILPAFVLAVSDTAALTRYTRSSMLDVLKQDYIRTAKSKGFKERKVVIKHGVRNGMIPIITMFGLMIPSFIGGAAVTEKIFSWPGIGQLFIDSAYQRDYPVIMGLTVISAVLVVIGNLIADILYAICDPRIEY